MLPPDKHSTCTNREMKVALIWTYVTGQGPDKSMALQQLVTKAAWVFKLATLSILALCPHHLY